MALSLPVATAVDSEVPAQTLDAVAVAIEASHTRAVTLD